MNIYFVIVTTLLQSITSTCTVPMGIQYATKYIGDEDYSGILSLAYFTGAAIGNILVVFISDCRNIKISVGVCGIVAFVSIFNMGTVALCLLRVLMGLSSAFITSTLKACISFSTEKQKKYMMMSFCTSIGRNIGFSMGSWLVVSGISDSFHMYSILFGILSILYIILFGIYMLSEIPQGYAEVSTSTIEIAVSDPPDKDVTLDNRDDPNIFKLSLLVSINIFMLMYTTSFQETVALWIHKHDVTSIGTFGVIYTVTIIFQCASFSIKKIQHKNVIVVGSIVLCYTTSIHPYVTEYMNSEKTIMLQTMIILHSLVTMWIMSSIMFMINSVSRLQDRYIVNGITDCLSNLARIVIAIFSAHMLLKVDPEWFPFLQSAIFQSLIFVLSVCV